jgi:hypothetical protein
MVRAVAGLGQKTSHQVIGKLVGKNLNELSTDETDTFKSAEVKIFETTCFIAIRPLTQSLQIASIRGTLRISKVG